MFIIFDRHVTKAVMKFDAKIQTITDRHAELTSLMASGELEGEEYVSAAQEYAELEPVVQAGKAYHDALSEQADLNELLSDPEMKDMATEELQAIKDTLPSLEKALQLALIPKDKADTANALLEIRAGTGGDEAALFAADLFGMYKGFASAQGWRLEVMEASSNDIGGYKEIIAQITGTNVFAKLKYESGVHRVQRVPATESSGRIHTSAATVAVMPEAEDVDIEIRDEDLRIDTYRSQGSGGQHVNTTDSAVRITHLPTNTVVAMQDEKSQHKNKAKAMKILKSRILDNERQKAHAERAADRKSQVGSGDRSERIRTYNYPQGRVTDHRINLTLHSLDKVIIGEALGDIVDSLAAEDQAAMLADLNG